MVKVKPLDEISKRYQDSATEAGSRYARAIKAVNDWKSKAVSEEAERLWQEKLQEAMAAKRRQRALEQISNEEWKSRAASVGPRRITEGIRESAEKQKRGFAPYHSALASLELPPRSADFRQNIDNRLVAVVETLVNKKKEIKG